MKREGGFTLLEVIVALMIAGFALAAMLGSLEAGLAGGSRVERDLRATSMARSQLAGVLATLSLRPGTQSYDLEGPYHSTVEIRQVSVATPKNGGERLGLFSVSVRVDENGTTRSVTLNGRAVRPAMDE
ncbi:prepilin-type N-terminal cleavage/methylation domain-containing protein [Acetobacter estunensis]|uniref:type IV pilus modification PilV family protein n=1 Tax=Acetobacter estunensis TaxID=104097 RepID=UPI001C2CECE2|nr:type II secretion system protein [Acetobacter estunensis]MBV1836748.1 type II secretion system GspH family protein [Acetobacter estunensis]